MRPLISIDRFGVLGIDELAYFGGARALLEGFLPYRDFVFVHPPLIVESLVPFAWLGTVGLTAAKVAWAALGAGSAVLVARLASRRGGWMGALIGGLLYATWRPSVGTSWNLFLEPVVTIAALAALSLSLSEGFVDRRRTALGVGLALALASTAKLTAVAPVVAIVAFVVVPRGQPRTWARVTIAYLVGLALIVGPFVIATPGRFVDQLITAQASRSGAEQPTSLYRIVAMLWPGSVPSDPNLLLATIAVVGLAVAGAVAFVNDRQLAAPCLAWLAGGIALSLAAPSFYDHYGELIAAPIALLAGTAVGAALVTPTLRRALVAASWGVVVLAAVSVVFGARFALSALPPRWHDMPGSLELASELVNKGECVSTDSSVTGFETPDHLGFDLGTGGPAVDSYGTALAAGKKEPLPAGSLEEFAERLEACQWFAGSSSWSALKGYPGWTPEMREWFRRHFELIGRVDGGIELWRRE